MSQKQSSAELFTAWNAGSYEVPGPQKALSQLYSEGLQLYSDWLGDEFYPFFGIEDFGLAKVGDLPDDASPKDAKFYMAAKYLAAKLNNLNVNIFDKTREGGNSLAKGNWPGNDLQVYDYEFYK